MRYSVEVLARISADTVQSISFAVIMITLSLNFGYTCCACCTLSINGVNGRNPNLVMVYIERKNMSALLLHSFTFARMASI